jgi:preprotein translocase subunit SecG
MFYFLLSVHLVLCVALVCLVLLQQGKGADLGATLGGGGANTVFGAGGATDFIVKITTGIAITFMVTSILLVKSYKSVVSDPSALVDDKTFEDSAVHTEGKVQAAPATGDSATGTSAPMVNPASENPAAEAPKKDAAPPVAEVPPAQPQSAPAPK